MINRSELITNHVKAVDFSWLKTILMIIEMILVAVGKARTCGCACVFLSLAAWSDRPSPSGSGPTPRTWRPETWQPTQVPEYCHRSRTTGPPGSGCRNIPLVFLCFCSCREELSGVWGGPGGAAGRGWTGRCCVCVCRLARCVCATAQPDTNCTDTV